MWVWSNHFKKHKGINGCNKPIGLSWKTGHVADNKHRNYLTSGKLRDDAKENMPATIVSAFSTPEPSVVVFWPRGTDFLFRHACTKEKNSGVENVTSAGN